MYWYSEKLNKKYYFKHQALVENDISDVEFHMGEVYDTHDWYTEPKDSWKEILKNHAQKLRDKYRYLRLWYSGGSDSQTVLNAFVDNNIHLDEIGIVRMSPTDDFNATHEDEQNKVAIPQVRELANKLPRTKIGIYDLGYDQHKDWFENHFELDKTNIRSFHLFLPTNIHKLIPGINDREGLGNINCVEPARLGQDDWWPNGWYWYFVDTCLWENITSPEEEELVKQEKFYLDPVVHAKQCWMIKNNITRQNKTLPNWHRNVKDYFDEGKWFSENIKGVCRDPLYVDITMGKQGGSYFGNSKSQLSVEAALANSKTKHLVETYEEKMRSHGLNDKFFNNGDPLRGYLGILTKKYYLT